MPNPPGEAEYPIAAVSKLTGVSCHSLRVWERRYGFPVPHRSPSGHRRYDHGQVLLLRKVAELLRKGQAIRDLTADARAGRLVPDAGTFAPPAPRGKGPGSGREGEWDFVEIVDRMLDGDLAGGAACFERLQRRFAPAELSARVIAPALTEVGDRWFRRKCSVFQERCVSGFLRGKLVGLIEGARRENATPARTLILGAVQGERHEGGLLVAHHYLEQAGWRVINLGADLPVAEFALAADRLRPDALAVSFSMSRNITKRFKELAVLRGRPVFVGGRSVLNYQSLARRWGLIPVPGPAGVAVRCLGEEFEAWSRREAEATVGETPGPHDD